MKSIYLGSYNSVILYAMVNYVYINIYHNKVN